MHQSGRRKRNTANDTQYYYDVKNEKVLMIFDGMVDGEDNPELIEKILVMHGKQQQKQQEDLDDAADPSVSAASTGRSG